MDAQFDPRTYVPPADDDGDARKNRSARCSIYLGPNLQRLHSKTPKGSSLSLRLEESVRRLGHICRVLIPEDISSAEWAVLVMALQYVDGEEEDRAWSTLLGWGFRYGSQVEEQYGLDVETMARQLRDRGPAANIAIVEYVTAYWEMTESLTHMQRLELLGLIPSPTAEK